MSRIKGQNTKPEMLVRKFLFSNGLRYRLHVKELPGKPDIVLSKYRTVIFINGCFWHGHAGCKYYVVPKTRTEWWQQKINGNITNDEKAIHLLEKNGWRVITVWECDLKKQNQEVTLKALLQAVIIN